MKDTFIYKARDYMHVIWIIVGIIVIILIAPMRAKDIELCDEDKILSSRIDTNVDYIQELKTEQAVIQSNSRSMEKIMESMQKDIRFLVLERGGTPSQ